MTDKKIALIGVRGTNEPGTGNGHMNGMLFGFSREVVARAKTKFSPQNPGPYVELVALDYPATYANPKSYGRSRTEGEQTLVNLVHKYTAEGFDVYLAGYSQGATLAGNVGTMVGEKIKGLYLLSDSLRPRGANSTGQPHNRGYNTRTENAFHGWGVAGERTVYGPITRHYAIPGDVIADAFDDSLVRSVADFSEWFGFTPQDLRPLAADILRKVQERAFQNLSWFQSLLKGMGLLKLPEVASESIKDALSYPRVHTSYGSTNFPGRNHNYLVEMARDFLADAGIG